MHSFLSVNSSFFPGASDGNESDCASNPYVYAAAFANQFGPTDLGLSSVCSRLLSVQIVERPRKMRYYIWGYR